MFRKTLRTALAWLKSKRLRRLVTPFAWLALSLSASAQIQLCPWKTQGDLPPRQGRNEIVEWGSLADGANDLWQLTTFVVNRDKNPRMIAWEVGGIRVENLRPGDYAITCSIPVLGRADRTGPLYFARDSSSLPTTVYDGPAPRDKPLNVGQRLTLKSQVLIQDSAKKPTVSVSVTTEVVLLPNGSYQVTYVLENLTDAAVDVEFAIDPSVVQQLGNTRTLKAKDYAKVVVTSPTFPYFVRYPMSVSNPASPTVTGTFDVSTAKPTAHKTAAR